MQVNRTVWASPVATLATYRSSVSTNDTLVGNALSTVCPKPN